MSNVHAGGVYNVIIDRVIQASESDFEELGVDRKTLEEMKDMWKKKLSDLHIAHLPWDPSPTPAAQITNTPTVPSNVTKTEDPSPAAAAPPPPQQAQPVSRNGASYPPHIKSEPGFENSLQAYPQVNGGQPAYNPQLAHQRATANLQRQFGSQAEASIAAGMQQPSGGGLALPGQQRPHGLQLPGQGQPRPQGQQYQQQPQQRNHLGNAQTDGADEEDEDAINSDLDDSEDELQQQESDEQNVSEVMVCVYDKVARVKNKWKCTLKDGILTTNGKDYVFHKATGEFEW